MPNFTWDKTTHKLRATPDAWKAAEKVPFSALPNSHQTAAEVNKTQKVHLPAYDQLCILCPAENPRLRQRSVGKPRSSLGAHSDSSSMISVGNPQTPQMGLTTPMGPNGQLLELTMSNGLMPWDDISDETDYEGSFTINGVSITVKQSTDPSKSSRWTVGKSAWRHLTARCWESQITSRRINSQTSSTQNRLRRNDPGRRPATCCPTARTKRVTGIKPIWRTTSFRPARQVSTVSAR